MKKLIVILFIYISLFTTFSQNKIKILILNFENINNNEEYNYIKDTISDALKASLYKIEKFEPYLLENVNKDLKEASYDYIIKYALTEKFDVLIRGHYYISEEKIRINFSVIDTLSGRLKISYDKESETGIEIFNIIKIASNILSEKMDKEINPYPQEIAEKKRRERLAARNIESLMIVNGIALYNFSIFDNKENKVFKNNTLFHSVSTIIGTNFYFELPDKRTYLGFEFSISVPVIAPSILIPNLKMELNFIYSFKKRHFFGLGYSLFLSINDNEIIEFYKDNNISYSLEQIFIFYPVSFIIKYGFHINEKNIIEISSTIYPPFWPDENNVYITGGWEKTQLQSVNNISVKYSFNIIGSNHGQFNVYNNSKIIPVDFIFSYYFYPVEKIGFSISTKINIIYINFNIPPNSFGISSINFGELFIPVISVSFGISLKDKYLIKLRG